MFYRISCLLLAAWCGLCRAADDAQLEEYFAALRSRGLHLVAEEYATARLAGRSLPLDEQTVLTLQLAQTLLEHGALASSTQRKELWHDAEKWLRDLRDASPDNPCLVELDAWLAMAPAIEGAALAWESQLAPENITLRNEADNVLRRAVASQGQILAQLDSRSTSSGTARRAEKLDAAQRLQLQQLLQLRLAEALLWRAELMGAGTERTALLLDASSVLDRLLRSRPRGEWLLSGQLAQARQVRLQGDDQKAAVLLDAIATADLSPLDRDRILAEKVRLEIARGHLDEALRLVKQRQQQESVPSDEFRAVSTDALLAAARLAARAQDSVLQRQLLDEANAQHAQTLGRWSLWSAAGLSRMQQDLQLGPELAALERQAIAAWQAEDLAAAAQAYGAASRMAQQSGLADRAVEYALTQGSILLKGQKWTEAAAVFQEIATSFPQHPRTPEADLLRCYALGRGDSREMEFTQALQDHLARYPDSPTRWEALFMLAGVEERRQQRDRAVALYRQVPQGHTRAAEAEYRTLLLDRQLLERNEGDPQQRSQREQQILADVRRVCLPLLESGTSLTVLQCQTLLEGARLLLGHTDRLYADADRLLTRIQAVLPKPARGTAPPADPDPQWKQIEVSTAQLRIVSLAGQQQLDQAREMLKELQSRDPAAMLPILLGLTELAAQIEPRRQYELGYLQHLAVQDIASRRGELTTQQQRILDESEAQAQLAMGHLRDALTIYQRLLEAAPNDPQLLRAQIHVCLRLGQKGDLLQARDLWTRIEKLQRSGTPDWIEARLEIADLSMQLGERDNARKLLGITRTLYPQLGTPELKSRADELWAKLK